MTHTRIRITVGVALSLLGAAQARSLQAATASGTLRLATSGDFAPFNSEQGGSFSGFDVELGNLVAGKLGLRPVWTKVPFEQLLNAVNGDQADLVVASQAITPSRAAQSRFSQPYYCTGGVLVTHAGGPLTAPALEGHRIATWTGSTYLGYLQKLPFQKTINVYASTDEATQALALRHADALLTDKFVALDTLKTYHKAGLVVSKLLWKERIGMAVARNNPDLQAAVDRALADLKASGAYQKLSQKYFGEDVGC